MVSAQQNTTNTTVASTTSSSTTMVTTTTNAHPNAAVNQLCPENPGTTDRVRVRALVGHNYRRSQLARGRVRARGGRRLPKAANMRRMRYDCALETSARQSAERCVRTPWPQLPAGVQENIFKFYRGRARYRRRAIKIAIRHWWRQVHLHGIGPKVYFRRRFVGQPIAMFTR
ncbi:SCP-like protein, partial [Ostertagia ostertagi]